MALTAAQFKAWLGSDTANVCTLVELSALVGGTETTLYLSNKTYNCTPTDQTAEGSSRANVSYQPAITNSIEFSENLPIDGQATISFGDIAVDNTGGVRDAWMSYVVVNRSISIFVGDPRWPRSDFVRIYTGLAADIAFSDRNTINISIRSVLEKLNVPLTAKKIGDLSPLVAPNAGNLQNKDQLVPLLFGEVFNVTPVSIDPSSYTYMVHDGPIERIIEVRDNGVPLTPGLGYVTDATKGTFRLLRPPAGTITCSAQGEQTTVTSTGQLTEGIWASTVAKLIQVIVLKYGKLTALELNLDAFSGFDLINDAAVGVYVTSNTNIISMCQQLAASLGAQFTATRSGLVTLLQLSSPVASVAAPEITDAQILRDSLSIAQKLPVRGTIKLDYVRNYTVQTQLLTGLPEEHKVIFGTEYRTAQIDDPVVVANYMLSTAVESKQTALLTNAAAQTEAERLLNLWKTPRYVFRLQGTKELLVLALGDMVRLTHYRFGLASTKPAQIISMQTNWNSGAVALEVLV